MEYHGVIPRLRDFHPEIGSEGVALLSKPPEFLLLLLYIATVPLMSGLHVWLGGQAVLLCDLVFVLVVLVWLPTIVRGNLCPRFFDLFLLLYLGATLVSALVAGAGYMGVVKVFYLVCVAGLTRRIAERSPETATTAWLVGTGVVVIGSLLGVATFYLGWSSFLENPLLPENSVSSSVKEDQPNIIKKLKNSKLANI